MTYLVSKLVLIIAFITVNNNVRFIYGINGHPFTQEAYKSNINTQISSIKNLKCSYYRIDFAVDTSGRITNEKEVIPLLKLIVQNGIKVLPVLPINKYIYSVESMNDIEKDAVKFAASFVKRYGKYFDYYEVGNEEATNIIVGPHVHGDRIEHYNSDKAKRLMVYYQAVCSALKKYDYKAKIIINEGWVHYGFFDYLKNSGVNYDIIGYHAYSEMGDLYKARENFGNVIDSLAKKFNKTIWITEFNIRNGTSLKNRNVDKNWLIRNLKFIYANSNVKGVFMYELFDQPAFSNAKSNFYNPNEAGYGLITWRDKYKKSVNKDSFILYKNFISKNP